MIDATNYDELKEYGENMTDMEQIQYIRRTHTLESNESITHVCGECKNGTPWRLTLANVIRYIESGKRIFYAFIEGQNIQVIVAIGPTNHKYLKTALDGPTTNSLLNLPDCERIIY